MEHNIWYDKAYLESVHPTHLPAKTVRACGALQPLQHVCKGAQCDYRTWPLLPRRPSTCTPSAYDILLPLRKFPVVQPNSKHSQRMAPRSHYLTVSFFLSYFSRLA